MLILDRGTEKRFVVRFTLRSVCALGKSLVRIRHGTFLGLRDILHVTADRTLSSC